MDDIKIPPSPMINSFILLKGQYTLNMPEKDSFFSFLRTLLRSNKGHYNKEKNNTLTDPQNTSKQSDENTNQKDLLKNLPDMIACEVLKENTDNEAIERLLTQIENQYTFPHNIQNLHQTLFPEEYDYLNDTAEDIRKRRIGISPMRQDYIDSVNQRRRCINVEPYELTIHSPLEDKQAADCTQFISSWDYCNLIYDNKEIKTDR